MKDIPILDLGPYLQAEPGALKSLAAELQHAEENVGFYFVKNHGVPQDLIDGVFDQTAAFHARPLEEKLKVKVNDSNQGYLPMRGSTTRSSKVNVNTKPNVNEAFFVKRDLSPDHPDVLAKKRFRGLNQWPDPAEMPKFRSTVLAYCDAMETLGKNLLPVYAVALDLEPNWFDEAFNDPQFTLRMTRYPKVEAYDENEFGIAPHTDSSFMTILAQSKVAGLEVRKTDGTWIQAPALPGHFIINSGDMLNRWTNERFLSTPHRAANGSATVEDRYAIPFFFDCTRDYVMKCIPTCTGPGNPPKYEPTTYAQYMDWFMGQNYDHVRKKAS